LGKDKEKMPSSSEGEASPASALEHPTVPSTRSGRRPLEMLPLHLGGRLFRKKEGSRQPDLSSRTALVLARRLNSEPNHHSG
jgi:hypothetical protein